MAKTLSTPPENPVQMALPRTIHLIPLDRIAGSEDMYASQGRTNASVNFITCHDGFTLWDLYSYNSKHNLANGWNNTDGANDNHSWNCGVEGKTGSSEINALRRRMCRNAFALLMCSRGTPMNREVPALHTLLDYAPKLIDGGAMPALGVFASENRGLLCPSAEIRFLNLLVPCQKLLSARRAENEEYLHFIWECEKFVVILFLTTFRSLLFSFRGFRWYARRESN